MNKKIDEIIFYLTIICVALFVLIILLLIAGFVFNILSIVSMQNIQILLRGVIGL